MVAEGEQRGDDASTVCRDVVAAGLAMFVDELLAAELAQVVGGLPGGVAVLPGELADLAACLAAVNPPGAGAGASAAASAARIRGLFRSIPAILLVPAWAGSGNSSRMPSGRKPMSAQSSAVANRSAIAASMVMIWS